MNCLHCGLLKMEDREGFCFRFKKNINLNKPETDCIYYIKRMYEDGEALSPQQHLILQDQDFRSKKMQGPMR